MRSTRNIHKTEYFDYFLRTECKALYKENCGMDSNNRYYSILPLKYLVVIVNIHYTLQGGLGNLRKLDF